MKKFISIFIFILCCSACDDGDIIVTSFDFDEDAQLTTCTEQGENPNQEVIRLLYTTNSEPSESLSLSLTQPDFTGKFEGLAEQDSIVVDLNQNNRLVYRTYNGPISGSDYFCNDIPPSEPQVEDEYISTNGGRVIITTTIIEQDDNDGIPAEEEDLNGDGNLFNDDTDGDGIPNFLDIDDDNDNVLTLNELGNDVENDNYLDTDNDGIPDYLDSDDDGDGVLTRNEDLNANDNSDDPQEYILNPSDDDTNGNGIPNYLDPEDTLSEDINVVRANRVSRTFRTIVVAKDITMENTANGEEIILETLTIGRFQISSTQEFINPN
ncbi:hypothetical protein [Mesonia maritima]|uniref:Uncharacterized protein n=1 Tax=Mesonia maritima TaxID=1793873 RepID=A0ABU1K9C1_9FLAO|nr:hypothetical protein [Mesonia maritima]MDR6302213.1 hypothetical protein [Mesonia maritima]